MHIYNKIKATTADKSQSIIAIFNAIDTISIKSENSTNIYKDTIPLTKKRNRNVFFIRLLCKSLTRIKLEKKHMHAATSIPVHCKALLPIITEKGSIIVAHGSILTLPISIYLSASRYIKLFTFSRMLSPFSILTKQIGEKTSYSLHCTFNKIDSLIPNITHCIRYPFTCVGYSICTNIGLIFN